MRNFTEIAFTDDVKSIQEQQGSRKSYQKMEQYPAFQSLSDAEVDFIQNIEVFYQATVNDDGWPYVQHRGGPKGFLKVIGSNKIAYPDFKGNKQYISVGNIKSNHRVSLILMDYTRQARLKIWATAKTIERDADPKLIEQLQHLSYKSTIERAVLLTVEATDWNCPQHIQPRFTQQQVNDWFAPHQKRLDELEAENFALKERLENSKV